ncbi:MAG: ACT domain-containing protein [bacterium]
MHEKILRLWAQTKLYVWPEAYYLISLPLEQWEPALFAAAHAECFSALIRERDEISVTLSAAAWHAISQKLSPRTMAGPYRVITFDLDLDLSVCGYFAPAAERLAEAGVSIVPQCAYLKDHVLIQSENIEQAVEVLQKLIESACSAE